MVHLSQYKGQAVFFCLQEWGRGPWAAWVCCSSSCQDSGNQENEECCFSERWGTSWSSLVFKACLIWFWYICNKYLKKFTVLLLLDCLISIIFTSVLPEEKRQDPIGLVMPHAKNKVLWACWLLCKADTLHRTGKPRETMQWHRSVSKQ